MHTILERRSPDLSFFSWRPPSLGIGLRLRGVLRRAVDTLLAWQERRAQRLDLTNLETHMLKDIGLTRAQAEVEARRPFWD